MIVSDNWVYVAPPKTGTRTMYAWLLLHGGTPLEDHRRDIPKEHQGKFVFTTIRNPYARAVSIYRAMFWPEAHATLNTLEELTGGRTMCHMLRHFIRCEEDGWRSEVAFPVSRFVHLAQPVMYLRLESLAEDVKCLPFAQDKRAGHENAIAHATPNVRDVLSPLVRELVQEWAHEDFEIGGYER